MRFPSAFNDTIWAVPADGHVPLPSPLPLARKSLALEMLEAKRKSEELVDIQKIPHQDWLEFTETPDTIEHTDLISSDWVQKGPQCRSHDLDPEGEAAFYHPSFRFTQNAHAVRVQLEELRPGKPKEKIWDVIFAGGDGRDNEVLREDTPVGGKLPLFKEFCQPLSEDTRWELRVTDVTPNKKAQRGSAKDFSPAKERSSSAKEIFCRVLDAKDAQGKAGERSGVDAGLRMATAQPLAVSRWPSRWSGGLPVLVH